MVKDSKVKVENFNNKKENIDTANEVGNQAKDAVLKEAAKSGFEKYLEEYQFHRKL